jgi:hypothetical protein
MSELPTPDDWASLGIAPTDATDVIRRAYREQLKKTGPETDPEGFQRLRAAYEAALQACPSTPAAVVGSTLDANAFVAALAARRAAGDEAGAIALVDETRAAHPPGSAASEVIENALLDHVALERMLSPALFLHLARVFDWRDTQGHAARRDPEHHAVVLDRIAAEDFFAAFSAYAQTPEGKLEALVLAPHGEALERLTKDGIGPEQRAEIRGIFDQFLSHGAFLMGRLDGGTLALLRQAVEGPPLLGESVTTPRPAAVAPPASAAPRVVPTLSKKTQWKIRAATVALIGAVVLGRALYKSDRPTYGGNDTALAASVALPLLKDPKVPWVDMVQEPDGVRVDWAPVMRMRHAIRDLRIGYNDGKPTTVFPLPQFDAPIGFLAPPNITAISMRIRTTDGVWSEIRRYPVRQEKK